METRYYLLSRPVKYEGNQEVVFKVTPRGRLESMCGMTFKKSQVDPRSYSIDLSRDLSVSNPEVNVFGIYNIGIRLYGKGREPRLVTNHKNARLRQISEKKAQEVKRGRHLRTVIQFATAGERLAEYERNHSHI